MHMAQLKGSKTHTNLKAAFAGESQANRRYLYFAKQADVEGYPEVAGNFRDTAEGETGHAHGHLDFLKKAGDPATDLPIGDTTLNLKAAIHGETHEYTDMYPGMAKTAREEGFTDVADWFETLAKAEKSHAGKFTQMLKSISCIASELRSAPASAHAPQIPGFELRSAARVLMRREQHP
jgi:rubrerythrin